MLQTSPNTSTTHHGFALVLVLAVVVLASLILIIATERSTTDIRSSDAFSKAEQVRRLNDMALNLVMAQIRDATTINQTTTTPIGQRDIWASQPGALRTFASNGSLRRIYKLYSSNELQTNDADLSGDIPNTWHTRPTEFTDINEPVDASYPILNPNVASVVPGATGIVQGFGIESAAPIAPGSNPAPMPVRWIYVLEDGTLCQLGDSRINIDSNAIVGRIAFWTDDETTKVNLNTAAPVTADAFWDAPRAFGTSEINTFAWRQPSQNEYQRYPGHPAMVSLQSVLGALDSLALKDYYGIAPRYRWGGSEEGGKEINVARTSLLTNKEDRPYVTVDELLFKSIPSEKQTEIPANIQDLRFFLTASSQAPELNLFGQPRVTIWPIYGNQQLASPGSTRRTPFDELIAFSSTLGGKAYYFAREQPLSATHDYDNLPRNKQLYTYLQRLTNTPVPGSSGPSFLTKYGDDRDQILTQIFDYIRITNLNETYEGRDANFVSYTKDMSNLTWTTNHTAWENTKGAGFVVPIQIGNTRGQGRFPVITEFGLFFITRSLERPPPEPVAPNPSDPVFLSAMLAMESITTSFGYMPWSGPGMKLRLEESTVKVRVNGTEYDLFGGKIGDYTYRSGSGHNYPTGNAATGGATPGGYDGATHLIGPDGDTIDSTPYRFFSDENINTKPGSSRIPLPFEQVPGTGTDADNPPTYALNPDTFDILEGEIVISLIVEGQVVQRYRVTFPEALGVPLPEWSPARTGTLIRGDWRARFHPNIPHGPLSGDVIQSVELSHGDARLLAGSQDVDSGNFIRHELYGSTRLAHGFRNTAIPTDASRRVSWHWVGGINGTYLDPSDDPAFAPSTLNLSNNAGNSPAVTKGFTASTQPKISSRISKVFDQSKQWSGDFDNAYGLYPDGPFINKADEGMYSKNPLYAATITPYIDYRWAVTEGFFSPLRQVPSPVMFGSLPTGVKAGIPWRTLLFCPNPADPNHIGFQAPADHLLLDLFRMPVVEPLALSGPASTNGKINMNYRPAPFSYIRRQSSLYAALETLKFFVVEDSQSATYKTVSSTTNFRRKINIPETLTQFETRFNANQIFNSPSEICSLFLVPEGESLSNVQDLSSGYWSTERPTGDNSREKPYAELYPKLTTQSNTFTVHVRVQALPQSDGPPAGGEDFKPVAEYRGSTLIERFLNPDDPQFATVDPDVSNLNQLYQFRVLQSRQFVP